MGAVLTETPDDPVDFLIEFLSNKRRRSRNEQSQRVDSVSSLSGGMGGLGSPGSSMASPRRRRRAGVSAEPGQHYQNTDDIVLKVYPKTEDDRKSIVESTKDNFMFASLDPEQMTMIVDAMFMCKFAAGDFIINQGDDGDNFYVLVDGECDCFVKRGRSGRNNLVKKYVAGESFGELALMYNCPRAASIQAKTDVSCWAVDRDAFTKCLMAASHNKRETYKNFLHHVPILRQLDRYELGMVAENLVETSYNDGEYILREGDLTKDFYIIVEGHVSCTKQLFKHEEPLEVMSYTKGDYFGELAPLTQKPRAANVIAVGPVSVISLNEKCFHKYLHSIENSLLRDAASYGEAERELALLCQRDDSELVEGTSAYKHTMSQSREQQSEQADKVKMLRNNRRRRSGVSAETVSMATGEVIAAPVLVPKSDADRAIIKKTVSSNFLFNSLRQSEVETVVDAMFEKQYDQGDIIIKQGDDGDNFYIVESGECECFVRVEPDDDPQNAQNNGLGECVKVYESGEGFGELALMYNCPRAASIRAKTNNVKLWGVDRATFRSVIMDAARKKRVMYLDMLSRVPVLATLTEDERNVVANCLYERSYAADEYVFRQGDQQQGYYLLVSGECVAVQVLDENDPAAPQVVMMELAAGEMFGECSSLSPDGRRQGSTIAKTPCEIAVLDASVFARFEDRIKPLLVEQSNACIELNRKLRSGEVPMQVYPPPTPADASATATADDAASAAASVADADVVQDEL